MDETTIRMQCLQLAVNRSRPVRLNSQSLAGGGWPIQEAAISAETLLSEAKLFAQWVADENCSPVHPKKPAKKARARRRSAA